MGSFPLQHLYTPHSPPPLIYTTSNAPDECRHELDSKVKVPAGLNPQDTIIPVDVGDPTPTRFQVHSKLLGSSSEFLKAKLKSEWLEENGAVKLPDHSAASFDIYVKWLYCRNISLSESNDHDDENDDAHASDFGLLAAAFILGDALLDDAFKDAVISALLDKVRAANWIGFFDSFTEMAKMIYEATPTASPARKFIVDVFKSSADGPRTSKAINELPHDFHCALTLAFATDRAAKSLPKITLKRCDYHRHPTSDPRRLRMLEIQARAAERRTSSTEAQPELESAESQS